MSKPTLPAAPDPHQILGELWTIAEYLRDWTHGEGSDVAWRAGRVAADLDVDIAQLVLEVGNA